MLDSVQDGGLSKQQGQQIETRPVTSDFYAVFEHATSGRSASYEKAIVTRD